MAMTTLTPRKDFRASDLAKGWGDVVTSPQFEAAAKTAMLELQLSLHTGALTNENAAAASYRTHGARMFLDLLMSLTDSAEAPKPKQPTLNYQA